MKSKKPTPDHMAFRTDAIALLNKHAGHLDATDMLALSAHLVGQIIAMQDQRKVTRELALAVVMENIEQGNAEVIGKLHDVRGSG